MTFPIEIYTLKMSKQLTMGWENRARMIHKLEPSLDRTLRAQDVAVFLRKSFTAFFLVFSRRRFISNNHEAHTQFFAHIEQSTVDREF